MLKKTFSAILIVLLCLLNFSSCKSKEHTETPAELVQHMKDNSDADIVWTEISPDNVVAFLGFDGRTAKDSAVFINNSEGGFDIVAVFEFEDEAKKLTAIEAINNSLTKAAENYKSISESETAKIQNRILMFRENTLALAAADNISEISEMLKDKRFKPPQ